MAPIFLEIENINKSFSGVRALTDVSMECRRGEILGLIGENGAGKSTLMKILAGSYQKDSGTIRIDGVPVEITSPNIAQAHGIGMVYQDTRLVSDLTVAQNIFLGREITGKYGVLAQHEMFRRSMALLEKLETPIPPETPVRALGMAEKQIVEIAKAYSQDIRLFILDEPTSAITPSEAQTLFSVLGELRAQGISILFISHRLSEVLTICDRFVVLKDGGVSGVLDAADANEEKLIQLMVGRSGHQFFQRSYATGASEDAPLFEVQKLSCPGQYSDISFSIYPGEIVGIFGIQGNGQREFIRTLAGLNGKDYTGTLLIGGNESRVHNPRDAARNKIAYLSDERRVESIFSSMSLADNVCIPGLGSMNAFGVLRSGTMNERVENAISAFDIKCSGKNQRIEQLSGGNQQKAVFASRNLELPKICIFNEPTVGIDVRTRSEIYALIEEMAGKGVAVLVASSDLVELINLADRMLIFSKGEITEEIHHEVASEERIMSAAVRGKQRSEASPPSRGIGMPASLSENLGLVVVTLLILAMIAVGSLKSDYFLTSYNFSNIALQVVPLILVALGQGVVLISGGIDLSVGQTISLTTAIASFTVTDAFPPLIGVVICICAGALIGLMNGFLSTKCGLPDLVASLAMGTGVNGLALIIRPTAGGYIDKGFMNAVCYRLGGALPVVFILALAVCALLVLYLRHFRGGVYVFAVGSGRDVAFSSGIRVERVKTGAYILCGVLATLAGLVVAARIGSGDPRIGMDFTMSSVTAAIVGGISLMGGRGKLPGAVLGAVMILFTQNILNMLHVSSYYQYVCIGSLLLIAVMLYQSTERSSHAHR
jgi:ribose transport system ATP-binding protein